MHNTNMKNFYSKPEIEQYEMLPSEIIAASPNGSLEDMPGTYIYED